MAGGKETPRQKLIGMMYLVLLALLALQVGAEIMNKFFELNESMVVLVNEADTKASATLAAIKKKVSEDGRDEAKVALEQANKLDKACGKVHDLIEKIKTDMIEKTDGLNPETGVPIGMKNTDISGQLLLGAGKGSQDGKDLEKELDQFVKVLNAVQKEVAELVPVEKADLYKDLNLTPDGSEHPLFKNSDDHKTANWLQISFDHTPMIAALAFLTEKEARVANLRAEVLQKIKNSMGAKDIKFDEVFPMASAESKVVAAGTPYEAKLFITARSSAASFKPEMFLNGKPIPVDGAEGKVKFRTSFSGSAVKGNDNLRRKTWKGTIKMKDGTGKPVTYEETFEYFVSKPVIQVQSASVSALYRNCGNELNIQVPALGSLYDPKFSVSGAQQRKGAKKGQIIVIPNSPQVSITVASGGQTIGTEKFKVRLVPKPDIVATYRGKEVDQKRGMKAPGPRSITMKAIPDESFKAFLPKDARYRVTQWEAILVRGKRPVSTKKLSGPEGNLASFAAQAKPGDRILIEVKQVQRMTYTGSRENVKLGTIIMNIPLTD